MVIFTPPCAPIVLNAYSTVPLLPELRTSVLHDYNIGSFARFHQPESVISIHDRPDFHGLSHLEIRIRLDSENKKDKLAIIDETTAESHALYPNHGEADIGEEVESFGPHYDPHNPQEPPSGFGLDWTKREEVNPLPELLLIASPGEWVWSDDPRARREANPFPHYFSPDPPAAVKLTARAASEAGLVAGWMPWLYGKPARGQRVEMRQQVDWYSPKWPWDGVTMAGGNGTEVTTAKRRPRIMQRPCQTTRRAPSTKKTKGPGLQRQKPSNVTATA
ncbi:MAG: hypothetical protein L6R36_006225 [Xanthoria steineri]|nr:MAG: hypothetical protein L6R36_006225 [Xanthoria steineri]